MADWENEWKSIQGGQNSQGAPQDNRTGSQQVSDIFRTLGLGAIPTIGAGVYEGGRALSSMLGNKNAYVDQNTGQVVQDPFATTEELGKFSTPQGGATEALKNTLGMASYAVPETEILSGGGILKNILAGVVNKGVQGAAIGGLQSASQGQNISTGALTGAALNPLFAGAGNAITDLLPRYIGFRNYGAAGARLPEVVKAENAAGIDTLKAARQNFIGNLSWANPEDVANGIENSPSIIANKQKFMNQINDLANSDKYIGTPGISDLVKKSKKAFPTQIGELPDIQTAIANSNDPFEAYNRIRNMVDWTRNTYGDKAASFLKEASHLARENVINNSDNPTAARTAMDNYAAETAMNAGKRVGKNLATGLTGGEGMLTLASSLIPVLQGFSPILAADTALTNPITGPATARGLVNLGEKTAQYAPLMRVLGISGANNLTQSQ